jgi:superfamily II RNA helicase
MTRLQFDFALDPFQKRAIQAISRGESVLVSAPTGAGKTVIAEYLIHQSLLEGGGVIYTAPIKALSNQKFRQFRARFPDKVGILTGDVNIDGEAPVVIMTTEIFRNRVMEQPESLQRYNWVIFDEIHYLDDRDRGTVWEEALIFLPDTISILGLSATIPNIQKLGDWLSTLHGRKISVITDSNRPVPLQQGLQCAGKIIEGGEKKRRHSHAGRPQRKEKGGFNDPILLLQHLHRQNRLPCLYFAFNRKRCEYLAGEAARHHFDSDQIDAERARERFRALAERFGMAGDDRTLAMQRLVGAGVAYHHAGLHPMLKEILEQLFSDRLLSIIFTTETFALGVNMPARSVVLDDLKKKYDRFSRRLKVRDFMQMAGRAGRRGLDPRGFVYSRFSPHDLSMREYQDLINGTPEPIESRFNLSYSTLLNLYLRYGDQLIEIYGKSFHNFLLAGRKGGNQERQLIRSRLKLLKKLGYIDGRKLTDKGAFSAGIHGYELILGEFFDAMADSVLTSDAIGVIALAAVYEPKKDRDRGEVPVSLKRLARIGRDVCADIHEVEKENDIRPLSKHFEFHLSGPLLDWMNGRPFAEVVEASGVDEGEFIRYLRMTVQVLRELSAASISQSLKRSVRETIFRINRDDIDAETQLLTVTEMEREAIEDEGQADLPTIETEDEPV